jgi:predicted RNA-binding protein with PIN domain
VTVRPSRTWVVDGSNVVGSRPDGWWRDRVGAAIRLADRLAALAAMTGDAVVLVLDGRPSDRLPAGERDGVRVAFARRAGRDAADDEIVAMLRDDPALAGRAGVVVTTSDRALAGRVRDLGATVVGAGALLAELDALDALDATDGSTRGARSGEDPRQPPDATPR